MVKQHILGLSGKKGSGKNTCSNYILGEVFLNCGISRDVVVTDQGQLWISDLYGDKEHEGIFDYDRQIDDVRAFVYDLTPVCKIYSFAALLKRTCMDVLGLTYEQCYGTNDQKNQLTHLLWENMPRGKGTKKPTSTGQMTAREVLQWVGTEVFRCMDNDVWINALLRQIKTDQSVIAIVTDVRFPNEATGIESAGGKVLRLTRNPFPDDPHPSETALDDYEFKHVLDNATMNVAAQNIELGKLLEEWGWFEKVEAI